MSHADPPFARLTGPADVLAFVSYLLGVKPASSLLLVAMHGRDGLVFVMRLDLPENTAVWQQLPQAVDRIAAYPQDGLFVVLIGYGPAGPVEAAVEAARAELTRTAVPVRDTLRVSEGRFWRLDCADPACCPADGVRFDQVASIATTAVYAAPVALPDRRTFDATLAPVTGEARLRMRVATATACAYLSDLVEGSAALRGRGATVNKQVGRAIHLALQDYLLEAREAYRQAQPVDDLYAATLTVIVDLPAVHTLAARLTGSEPWQILMWTDLVRRADPQFTAAPATLLALCAMRAGNLVLADLAVQRALATEPDHRLGQRLAQAINAGIHPDDVAAMFAN